MVPAATRDTMAPTANSERRLRSANQPEPRLPQHGDQRNASPQRPVEHERGNEIANRAPDTHAVERHAGQLLVRGPSREEETVLERLRGFAGQTEHREGHQRRPEPAGHADAAEGNSDQDEEPSQEQRRTSSRVRQRADERRRDQDSEASNSKGRPDLVTVQPVVHGQDDREEAQETLFDAVEQEVLRPQPAPRACHA